MSGGWYADRLRDDAGRMEAEIAELYSERNALLVQLAHCPDNDRDALGEAIDAIDDKIGALEQAVDDLDDDIWVEGGEWR